jgi:hypothetical protein
MTIDVFSLHICEAVMRKTRNETGFLLVNLLENGYFRYGEGG